MLMMPTQEALFLDTSVLIALAVHSPETKARIKERLRSSNLVITSAIVRQEYKRRLLKEAAYLLRTLERHETWSKLQRHLENLPPVLARKRNICVSVLHTVFEESDELELVERLRRYLRSMLACGTSLIDASVDRIVEGSGCLQSNQPIVEKKPYVKYNFGIEKCTSECAVDAFSAERTEVFANIGDFLTTEEAHPEWVRVCSSIVQGNFNKTAEVPCKNLGDLFIAVESYDVKYFYTMNGSDSQHLCKPLGQTMILRRKNPIHDDVVYEPNTEWNVD